MQQEITDEGDKKRVSRFTDAELAGEITEAKADIADWQSWPSLLVAEHEEREIKRSIQLPPVKADE